MSSKHRIGIIGAGFGRNVHFPAFSSRSDCRVISICSSSKGKNKALSNALGTDVVHNTWRDVLDDSAIDTVAVSVPPYKQFEIAKTALKSKKTVLLEKPLCLTSKQSKILKEIAEKNRTCCVVDFEFILLPVFQAAKEVLEKKKLGKVRDVRVHWNVENYAVKHRVSGWKTDFSRGGGALYNFGSHVLHYLQWMFGSIQSVSAQLDSAPDLKLKCDSIALFHLMFKSGISASVNISIQAAGCHKHCIEVFGSEGILKIDNNTADYIDGFSLYAGKSQAEMTKIKLKSGSKNKFKDGRIMAVSRVIETLFSSKTKSDYRDIELKTAHDVQLVMDGVILSDRAGKRVSIKR